MRIPHGLRAALASQGAAPAPSSDANFENVSLLLHGDGTNGAQNNTFVDGSTNNFTITRNGNTTQGTFSPFSPTGWSGYFDGTGDYLSLSANSAFNCTGDFTFELWVNPFSNSGVGGYQLWYGGASSTTYFGLKNNQYVAQLSNGGELFWTGQPSLNVWTHIALARSGSTITLYVNGTSVGTNTSSAAFCSSADAIQVGAWSGSYNMQGYFSNVRLVKGTAVYTSNFTPPTSPLTAITNTSLLTLQDNRFKDNSTNNFTITRNGDTRIEAFSPFNPTAAYSASTHGGSGYFDGSGDYLTVAANTAFDVSASAYTIEMWVYFGSAPPTTVLFGFAGTSTSGNAHLLYSGGTLYWQTRGTGANQTTYTWTPSTGSWYHLAVAWNGSNSLLMFIDGQQVASNTVSPTINQNGVNIGGASDGYSVNGYISNLRIVKGTAVYTSNFTPPTASLTAITNTSLLLNFTNGGIIDHASKNVLETVGNAQISTSVKKFGTGSMYFDGTGDYLKGPSNSLVSWTSENFTIEGWINFIADSNWTTVEKGLDWGLLADANRWVYKANQANVFVISWTPSLNTWYHFACVRNGSTTTMYINGSSIGSGTSVNAASTTAPITVGYSLAFNSYALNGYIDDLRITKGVARYTANFTPPTAAFPDL